ncbi:MAG: hypothetical protein ABR505_03215 [Actinomycetota bacterium]
MASRISRRQLATWHLVIAILLTLMPPALAEEKKKPAKCGEPTMTHDYTPQTMKVTFVFDVAACELVPRRFQGPYLSEQPDFVLVAVLTYDDTLGARAIARSATCWQDGPRCKIALKVEHFPIERATYSATAVLTSLKSPFVRAAAFYTRCTSVYMTSVCGI